MDNDKTCGKKSASGSLRRARGVAGVNEVCTAPRSSGQGGTDVSSNSRGSARLDATWRYAWKVDDAGARCREHESMDTRVNTRVESSPEDQGLVPTPQPPSRSWRRAAPHPACAPPADSPCLPLPDRLIGERIFRQLGQRSGLRPLHRNRLRFGKHHGPSNHPFPSSELGISSRL